VYGDDLLESIEGDEDKGEVELGRRVLRLPNVMDEESIQGNGLAVNNVTMIRLQPTPYNPSILTTRTRPVLRQRRFLQIQTETASRH